jgi:autotransporter-associated beta strand protein
MAGLLNVLGGMTTTGSQNSGVFQNAGGLQRVTSSGIALQASATGTSAPTASGAQIFAGGDQVIDAGGGNIQLIGASGGSGNAVLVSGLGNQTITAQDISLVGGSGTATASGAFLTGGHQTISARHIELRGGSGAGSNFALISSTTVAGADGDQTINVGAGGLQIVGGEASINNRAGIIAVGNQTVAATGGITITGGASGGATGNTNSAFLQAGLGRNQTISAASLTLTSGAGGIDNSAVIAGSVQTITTTGNISINGSSGGGSAPGPRIGGQGGGSPAGPTNLTMSIGGDLILTGGSATNNAATIGSVASTPSQANNITITAGGSVILDQDSGAGARIGTSLLSPTAGPGDISITAQTGSIELRGSTQRTAIRTTGNVTLSAGTTISEAGNGFIEADLLKTTSRGDTGLVGPNAVKQFDGTTTAGGNITLNNAGPLVVQAINAANAALTNAGSVAIRGAVTTTGTLNLNATGALSVEATGAHDVNVTSNGGQSIHAQSLTVTAASPGHAANIINFNGDQTIEIVGGSLDVQAADATSAAISQNGLGNQRITVTNGDHLAIGGVGSGFAFVGSSAAGTQTISITGGGANALSLSGNASIGGQGQSITAGATGEAGSISVSGVGSFIQGVGGFGSGQTISTSGAFTISGAQVLNDSFGLQQVRAGSLAITDGALRSNGGQDIAAGSVSLTGIGGQASITNTNSTQTIAVTGGNLDLVALGAGSSAVISNGSLFDAQTITISNGDRINVNGAGFQSFAGIQSSNAQSISITGSGLNAITVGSAGGLGSSNISSGAAQNLVAGTFGAELGSISVAGGNSDGFSSSVFTISGTSGDQTISTAGALSVTGGEVSLQAQNRQTGFFQQGSGNQSVTAASISLQGGASGSANGAFISSSSGGGNQTVTSLGDITLEGRAGGNAAIIGSPSGLQKVSAGRDISLTNDDVGGASSATILGRNQTISAARDVILTARASGGTLPVVRIGGASGSATSLALSAGNDLRITGGSAPDNGAGLGSSAAGAPMTNNINVTAGGSVVLTGGSASLTGARIGYSTVNGPAGGSISVTAGGDIVLNGNASQAAIRTTGNVALMASNTISENANGLVVANALSGSSGGDTTLTGPNQVASFSGTSTGGSVTLNNAGPVAIQGINAANAALIRAASVSGSGAISTGTGFTVDVSAASELNGVIGGAGGLTKNGIGFLSLGAVNTYAGDTNVNAGTLALAAPDQTTTGNVNIAAGATFRGSPGTYNNAGVIAGNGTLDVAATNFTNSGTLRPGGAGAIGTLTVQGNAVLNGTLDIEAQGAGAGNHDVLAVTGAATLGGGLHVTPINGYAPQGGDTLVPLTFASRSGTLNVTPTDWSATYNPGDLTLSFAPLNRWIAATGNWDLASNWSLGHVPTNFETVLIDVPGSQFVTVSRGAQAANRLTSNENFVIAGGSLDLGGASSFTGSLSLLGGELKGAGNVTVSGAFIWTGGRLTGAGGFLTSAATATLLAPLGEDLFLGKSWTNQGTATWFNLTPRSIVGSGSLQNAGTLNVAGRKATIETQFSNTGTLNLYTDLDLRQSAGNAGTINLSDGAKLKVHGTYTNLGRLAGEGTMDTDGGTLVNQGTLAPGGSGIGTFSVKGDFQQGATGLLEIDLGGTRVGQYDVLDVNGTATLGGTLFVRATNGYVPRDGDDFRLVTYKSRVGTFQFLLPPAGFTLDAEYGRKFASFELE